MILKIDGDYDEDRLLNSRFSSGGDGKSVIPNKRPQFVQHQRRSHAPQCARA